MLLRVLGGSLCEPQVNRPPGGPLAPGKALFRAPHAGGGLGVAASAVLPGWP